MALTIPPYAGQGWTDNSTPDLSAETLNAVDAGITANSNAINAIANAVVSQIVNDPNKIASMAALYAVNSNLTTLNNKFLLDSNYLAIKQVAFQSGSGGNDFVNISLSQMNISGKKIPDICAPMACISWNTGNGFWVVYCAKYDDTTLQVRFNIPIPSAFRVTLMFELINA